MKKGRPSASPSSTSNGRRGRGCERGQGKGEIPHLQQYQQNLIARKYIFKVSLPNFNFLCTFKYWKEPQEGSFSQQVPSSHMSKEGLCIHKGKQIFKWLPITSLFSNYHISGFEQSFSKIPTPVCFALSNGRREQQINCARYFNHCPWTPPLPRIYFFHLR